jgi:hypothetical protein
MTIMGKVAYTVLVAFIASVLTLVAVSELSPGDDGAPDLGGSQLTPAATVGATSSPQTGATLPAASPTTGATSGITLQQVGAHNSAASCWIVVEATVYDITAYIPRHPTEPEVLLEWCGKESTRAWEDKGGTGESHSSRAEASLGAYEIGKLAQ